MNAILLPPEKESESASPAQEPTPLRIAAILVPMDFSEPAYKAFRYAQKLARQFHSKIILSYVIENTYIFPADGIMGPPIDLPPYPTSECRSEIEKGLTILCKTAANESAYPVQSAVRIGTPYDEIISHARECAADLIVLATHGRTGLSHLLMGSTAEKVVQRAPCPVLVVR